MKRTLHLTSAAVALTFGLAPALAQDHTDNKLKRDPAATEQHDQKANRQSHKATPEHNAANRNSTERRSTTGQAAGEKTDNTKAAAPNATDSSAAKQGSTNSTKKQDSANSTDKTAQPQRAESNDQKKPSTDASKNANTTAPANKAATQNNTQSPGDQNRNAATTSPNRNAARTDNAAPKAQVSASLDPQKKTELHSAAAKIDAKPVTNVNFSVSVGTVVPRSVEVRPVPTTIVDIVPQYRGYDFFVVRDEVVIVEPHTHKIVDVIQRGPSRARAETTTTTHRPRLSAHQREVIRRHASSKRHVTTGTSTRTTTEITVGQKLPDTVEIESFPDEVYREVPSVREYRYIERGDDVYLVDPSTREVIEDVR